MASVSYTIPVPVYAGVLLLLLALALATLGVSYVDLERWNLVAAMSIAVVKMMLVVLFFMHGWYMPGISKLAFGAGLFWLALMVFLTMSDYVTRSMPSLASP
jgi:cytochrome c oxidase subunit 4